MRHARTVFPILVLLFVTGTTRAANPHCGLDNIIDCGTFHGDATASYSNGVRHESLILDGIDDHVRLSQVAPLPIYENNQFTVAFWVKGPPQDGVVYSKGVSADEGLFLVGADTNGRVRIFIEDDDDELSEFDVEETSSAVAFDNTWHHIAFTWDGDDAHLYIDGQEDSHYFNLSPNIDLTRSTVGARRDGNGTCCYFAGEVDEVFFRSFTLSAGRVLELYASTLELQTEQLPSGDTEISSQRDSTTGSPESQPLAAAKSRTSQPSVPTRKKQRSTCLPSRRPVRETRESFLWD